MKFHIVGYQNYALTGGFNFTANTFKPVSETAKLGDIKANTNVVYGNTVLQLLDDGGATCILNDIEELGEVYAEFYWVDAATAEAIGCDAGWYLSADDSFSYCQNNRALPYGQGIMIDCSDEDASVVYSGQVGTEDTSVTLESGFNFTGNFTPVTITLGDITANANVVYGNTVLQFLDDGGATCILNDIEELGEVYAEFYWVDAATAEAIGCDAGWYLSADDSFSYCQNNRVLNAGAGFMVDCSDEDAAVIIPAAL